MRAAYPKSPRDIKIRITHRDIKDGLMSEIKTTAEVPLNVKMYDYIVRLGCSSAHLVGFIVQLLTKGKVRVDFMNYTERLEMVDAGDKLSSAQAMTLFDDFVAEIGETGIADRLISESKATQQIVVQLPRKPGSSS